MSQCSIPMRETCQMCHAINTIGFHVPDEVWREVIHPHYQNSTVCVNCFIRRADEKMIEWDSCIDFYPVSKMTHMKVVALLTENDKAEVIARVAQGSCLTSAQLLRVKRLFRLRLCLLLGTGGPLLEHQIEIDVTDKNYEWLKEANEIMVGLSIWENGALIPTREDHLCFPQKMLRGTNQTKNAEEKS